MIATSTSPSAGPRVLIIGAGFGGLGAARALLQRGVTDIAVLERADEVGGVWRDNTYPGAACDVPSALYSWSWALNPRWRRRYSPQPEILDYLRSAAEREGLLDLVRTGQEVATLTYDEPAALWHATTTDGTTYDAEVVVTAVGQLSNPSVPALPGRDDFAGPAFHSARWRDDVDLRGRRVAVIGTGASAIQLVPEITPQVSSLAVFQRSAPYVVPKPDTTYRQRHHTAFDRFPAALAAERRAVFALTELMNAALEGHARWSPALLGLVRAAWRWQLRTQVTDPDLRRRLVPDYPLGCKRVLFSNAWYPALDQPHVALLTDAVERIEPRGVRTADGTLHEADVLIWGTGFAATSFLDGIRVTGVGGVDLHDEVWSDGAHAHLGVNVPGFPNLFCIYGPNTNLGGSSVIAMMEAQADYVAQVTEELATGRGRAVAVRPEAARAWDEEMQDRLGDSVWASCTSWYRDGPRITTNWPGQVAEYRARLAAVDWDELEVVS